MTVGSCCQLCIIDVNRANLLQILELKMRIQITVTFINITILSLLSAQYYSGIFTTLDLVWMNFIILNSIDCQCVSVSPYRAYQVFFYGVFGGTDARYEKQANLAWCDIHDFGCSTKVNVFPYSCPKIPYFQVKTKTWIIFSRSRWKKREFRKKIVNCNYGKFIVEWILFVKTPFTIITESKVKIILMSIQFLW